MKARIVSGSCTWIAGLCACAIVAAGAPSTGWALPIVVEYADGPDEGFNDPELGAARRGAFEHAVDLWSAILGGDVPVVVDVAMNPVGGSGSAAPLAQAGPLTLHRNFSGGVPNTFYAAALANQLRGLDVGGENVPEIIVTFNSDVDGPIVLGSVDWYYGLDGLPGPDIDFVTIALHELGHGLGFSPSIDGTTGRFSLFDTPGIFDRNLARPGIGSLAEMLTAERFAAITSGRVFWSGPHVANANLGPAALFTPDRFLTGTSLAHWDTSFSPDELMEPFYTAANHDPGLLLPALVDMGWPLAIATFTPGPPTATVTRTATSTPQPTPTPDGDDAPEFVFVTNFDAATVSVIDRPLNRVTATLDVGDGPIGVVASADGSTVYVASFHSATISVISVLDLEVVDTINVPGSANTLALTPDGSLLYVTDTYTETVSVIDTSTRTVSTTIPAPPQPAGVAVAGDGRAYVANFGGTTVSVVDPWLGEVVAKIVLDPDVSGPLGIAISPEAGFGYVTSAFSSFLYRIDTARLARTDQLIVGSAEAVAITRDGSRVYSVATDAQTGNGVVREIDPSANQLIRSLGVGNTPEAVAVTADGSRVYTANTGSDTVSFFNTVGFPFVRSIAVGAAPMGIAIARLAPEPTDPTPTPTMSPTSTVTLTATPTLTPSPTSTPTLATASPTVTTTPESSCVGDCDGSGEVTVDELVLAVHIALGSQDAAACPAIDIDRRTGVTVDVLVRATHNALSGCT
jgi:YVTN family beta-propeller protein